MIYKRLLLVLCSSLLYSFTLFAQQNAATNIRSSAPANASTAYANEWCNFHNPAVLAKTKASTFTLAYENRFQLKELSAEGLSFSYPNQHINIGIGLNHFGCTLYNETQIGLALAKSITPRFAIGLQANYYSVYLSPEIAYRSSMLIQFGLLSMLNDNWTLGFHAYNPSQNNIKVNMIEKRLPSIFSLGSAYRFNDELLALIQLDKEIAYDLKWRIGFEYQLVPALSFRMGALGSPFIPSMGTSLNIQKFRLSLNFEKHPTLGINSNCSLRYQL